MSADGTGPAPLPTGADLGRAVRRLRLIRRLTVEELAALARMHPTYLSGIERGGRNPTWRKVAGLSAGLGLPVHALARAAEGEAYGGLYAPYATGRVRGAGRRGP